MIVFQKNSIWKIISVVLSAAYTNSIFLKNTHIRRRFSGIQQCDPCSLKKWRNRMCIGCDPAHSLKIIQRHTLAGKKHPDISCNFSHFLTFFYFIAVLAEQLHFCVSIQKRKYTAEDFQSRNDSILFTDQIYLSRNCFFHNRVCGNVFAWNIFL